jgi:hypothetical protein
MEIWVSLKDTVKGAEESPSTVPPTPEQENEDVFLDWLKHNPPPSAARRTPQVPGYEVLDEVGRGGMGVVEN